MGILAVCHVLMGLVHNAAAFLLLAAVFGVLWSVGIPLTMALLFDISEPRFRGLNMNLALVTLSGAHRK